MPIMCPRHGGVPHCNNQECLELCSKCTVTAINFMFSPATEDLAKSLQSELIGIFEQIQDNCPN